MKHCWSDISDVRAWTLSPVVSWETFQTGSCLLWEEGKEREKINYLLQHLLIFTLLILPLPAILRKQQDVIACAFRRRRSQWATVNQHTTTLTTVFFASYSDPFSASSSTLVPCLVSNRCSKIHVKKMNKSIYTYK